MPRRPTVSVVVPFAGSELQLQALVSRLERLTRLPGDELIVADNRPGATSRPFGEAVQLHAASALASPGFARNRGAAAARGEWIVFIDADTEPATDLLDAYFDPMPDATTAVLAGGIEDIVDGDVGSASLAARHVVARGQMNQAVTLERAEHPYAQSANLAVRRDVLVRAGGFDEHIRAGEDADLCFRLAAAGFQIGSRPAAQVRHSARATLGAVLTQLVGHGSGAAWCNRRHPGSFPPPRPTQFLRRIAASTVTALRARLAGDREGAGFALLEIAGACAFELGRVIPNRPRWRPRP